MAKLVRESWEGVAIFERAALTPPSPQAKNAEAFCCFGRGREEDAERRGQGVRRKAKVAKFVRESWRAVAIFVGHAGDGERRNERQSRRHIPCAAT